MKSLPRYSFIVAALLGATTVPLYQVAFGESAEAREDDMLARARSAIDAGRVSEGADILARTIAVSPADPLAHELRAWLLTRMGDWRGAQAELDRLARLGWSDDRLRAMRAEAWLLRGAPETALKELAGGGIVKGDESQAMRIGAAARGALGDPAANADFTHLLATYGEDWENWVAFSRYRLAQGDRGGAIVAMDKALSLEPEAVEIVTARAGLVRSQYGLTDALAWYDRALAIDAQFAPALVERAATLADLGRGAEAGEALVAARQAGGDPGRLAYVDAVLAARAGDVERARLLLAGTDPATRESAGALLLAGVLDLRSGDAAAAARQFERLLGRQPQNRDARLLLARAWLDAGRGEAALEAVAPLAALPDASGYVLRLAARAHEAAGDRAAALPLLARAINRSSGQDDAASPLAADDDAGGASPVSPLRQLLAAGDKAGAVERARLVAARAPGAPQSFIALGDTLLIAGRFMDAAGAYQRAANLRFDEPTALRLVDTLVRAGQADEARKTTEIFLAQAPRTATMQRVAGMAALDRRDWKAAIAHLDAARALGGEDALLLASLARGWRGMGDAAKALPFARRAYALLPGNAAIAHDYAAILLANGDRSAAPVDLLEKAVALAPGNVRYHRALDAARRATKA